MRYVQISDHRPELAEQERAAERIRYQAYDALLKDVAEWRKTCAAWNAYNRSIERRTTYWDDEHPLCKDIQRKELVMDEARKAYLNIEADHVGKRLTRAQWCLSFARANNLQDLVIPLGWTKK